MNKKHHGYFHDACSKVKYQGYIPGINKHENWFLAMNKADVQGLMMNDSSKGKINWYYVFVTWIMNVCCGFFLFPPYLAICALLEIEVFFTISFCVFRRSSGELFYPIREMVFFTRKCYNVLLFTFSAYSSCTNDPYCAADTVQGYMRKFGQVHWSHRCGIDPNTTFSQFNLVYQL